MEIISKNYLSSFKRIWIAWAIINGIGAFIAYVVPFFSGLATLSPTPVETPETP